MRRCSSKNTKNKTKDRELALGKLMTALGFSFQDPVLLSSALVHSSYANENPGASVRHNERLEFLGDTVLDLVVSEWLYMSEPVLSEGEMTQARASVVCEPSLAEAARRIDLAGYLLLGCGERGRSRPSILADALEALIGAVYLDSGLEAARALVLRLFAEPLQLVRTGGGVSDYKSLLQQELQKDGTRNIRYRLAAQTGPAHNRTFVVEVEVDGVVLGSGSGHTKKEAEQSAAKEALGG